MDTLKVLAQSLPTVGILTDFYTVPAATQTTVSSIIICNLYSLGTSFSVSVAIGGAVDDPKQFIYYTTPLDVNDTFIATVGLSLASGDVIRVLSSTGNVSFNLFGVEIN